MSTKLIKTTDYLLLIDEKAEIYLGDYILLINTNPHITKCVNTEVHALADWRKIIAYYPLTKEAKELDLPLLPNPFETIDYKFDRELFNPLIAPIVEKIRKVDYSLFLSIGGELYNVFLKQYKAAQTKQFSLEDIKKAFGEGHDSARKKSSYKNNGTYKEDLDKFIQSLITQQLPKEFIPKFNKNTYVINSEGKNELVGTYKY